MQDNEVNQEDEEPKSLLRIIADWIDEREQRAGRLPVSPMIGLVFVEMVGVGFYIMLLTCSSVTIIIVSVSTVVGLIVLWYLEKLVRKIFFRKKSQVIKLSTLENGQNSRESLIGRNQKKSLVYPNSNLKAKENEGINIIQNEKD